MPAILAPGYCYRSKQVLARLAELHLVAKPHLDPSGWSILVFDLGDKGAPSRAAVSIGGRPAEARVVPPCLVPMAEDRLDADGHNIPGGDLQHVATVVRSGRPAPAIVRVEIPPDALGDLEPLVEYDHLPTYRKDYSVYPRGHKLA